jgi:hypothetical protein
MILIEWSLVDTTTTIMSSKDIASHVPMFISQDFRFWKDSMTDYLGAQKLLGYALGQRQRPVAANVAQPTQAELAAMADWDEIDLQVKSMISMRLSTNLSVRLRNVYGKTFNSLYLKCSLPENCKNVEDDLCISSNRLQSVN